MNAVNVVKFNVRIKFPHTYKDVVAGGHDCPPENIIIIKIRGRCSTVNELEITTFINTLSVAVANDLSENELILTAAILTQIGDTLATIAALKYG